MYGAGTMKYKHTSMAFVSTGLCAKQMTYVLNLIFITVYIFLDKETIYPR